MNLYEINSNIQRALDSVDPETGDITSEAFEQIDLLEMAMEEKVLNIGKWIKNMSSDSEALKNEIQALSLRKKSIDNKIERLKDYLQSNVSGKKFKDAQCEISWRPSESVEIIDETALPEHLIRVKVEKSPDKTAIKKAIKAGENVEAARIIESLNIQIK